jgi:mRNA interferase RelE/StbE
MAWYRLAFKPEVIDDLSRLEKPMAQRLFDKTKWLASNVENLRHEPAAPEFPTLSKYAVGDWRIFYSVDRSEQVLDIHCIAHRKDLTQPPHVAQISRV